MKLKELNLGSIDAKNELLTDTPEERERFISAFVVPPSLDINKYISGSRYFVTGLKGTGKTALLRYISICIEENTQIGAHFILFKSQLNEDMRKDFTRAGRESTVETNTNDFPSDDYESVWRWFIYRKILSICGSGDFELFQKNHEYEIFSSLILSPIEEQSRSIKNLIPKLKKGNIEISKDPKILFDFEWDSSGKTQLQFNKLVEKADDAFEALLPGHDRVNLFFDELELNNNTKKQYERDSKLIRDLIVTIEKINASFKKRGISITLYAAIRSEVQNSVRALGKEINKSLGDFGTEIVWSRAGIDLNKQPLLNVITKRLHSNIIPPTEYKESHAEEVWNKFFTTSIQGRDIREYILHNSWYRPRDIVRLLKIAQDQHPEEESFKHHVFDSIRKKYSEQSWIEITEELKTKYKDNEIEAIKRLLYGFKQYFSFVELRERAETQSELYMEVSDFLKQRKVQEVLSDLYRVGVIGNYKEKQFRFSFRGDDEILLEQQCFVHHALKAHLSIQ
ncbi:P-loop ATPase, Sll1717 family [Aeromonas sp. 602200]|uniref:P-loop ATPase, Sll1717 family n=1 Tax=Aeromonas sp. 602200 TaxID=2712040 RepID=UPI0038E362C8